MTVNWLTWNIFFLSVAIPPFLFFHFLHDFIQIKRHTIIIFVFSVSHFLRRFSFNSTGGRVLDNVFFNLTKNNLLVMWLIHLRESQQIYYMFKDYHTKLPNNHFVKNFH